MSLDGFIASIFFALIAVVSTPADARGRRPPGDRSREGINLTKIKQLVRLLRPRNTRTLARLRRFELLDKHLERLGQRRGRTIRGLILDIDETVAPHHGQILPENLSAIDSLLRAGVRVAVFSNAKAGVRLDALRERGIPIITHSAEGRPVAAKPAAEGFDVAASALGLARRQVVMVGDNYMTDGGAIRAGFDFIKVRPVPTPGGPLSRLVQRMFRGLYSGVARVHDAFRKPSRRALRIE